VVKRDLPIEFDRDRLTWYGTLNWCSASSSISSCASALNARCGGSDYGVSGLVLLIVTLPVVGTRRLEHLGHVATDRLVGRVYRLVRFPSRRTWPTG
jgi:hypothetical protein